MRTIKYKVDVFKVEADDVWCWEVSDGHQLLGSGQDATYIGARKAAWSFRELAHQAAKRKAKQDVIDAEHAKNLAVLNSLLGDANAAQEKTEGAETPALRDAPVQQAGPMAPHVERPVSDQGSGIDGGPAPA